MLIELSNEGHRPIGDAIERNRREKFWQGVQEDFARFRSDPTAWHDHRHEVTEWDASNERLGAEAPFDIANAEASSKPTMPALLIGEL